VRLYTSAYELVAPHPRVPGIERRAPKQLALRLRRAALNTTKTLEGFAGSFNPSLNLHVPPVTLLVVRRAVEEECGRMGYTAPRKTGRTGTEYPVADPEGG
jgi:hypothetical protein